MFLGSWVLDKLNQLPDDYEDNINIVYNMILHAAKWHKLCWSNVVQQQIEGVCKRFAAWSQ